MFCLDAVLEVVFKVLRELVLEVFLESVLEVSGAKTPLGPADVCLSERFLNIRQQHLTISEYLY